MTMTLAEMVALVADARANYSNTRSLLANMRSDWDDEHAVLIETDRRNAVALAEVEANLRAAAIAVYKETGTKSPTPGVGVRVLTKLRYDADTALRWAEDHKLALSLDKAAFERQARITPLSFVEVVETPQATIATDLSDVIAAQSGGDS